MKKYIIVIMCQKSENIGGSHYDSASHPILYILYEQAILILSTSRSTRIVIYSFYKQKDLDEYLTQSWFVKLTNQTDEILKETNLNPDDIDEITLTGCPTEKKQI